MMKPLCIVKQKFGLHGITRTSTGDRPGAAVHAVDCGKTQFICKRPSKFYIAWPKLPHTNNKTHLER